MISDSSGTVNERAEEKSSRSTLPSTRYPLPVLQPWQQFHDEQFRAELASVDTQGKRKWIYAKKPKGKFTRARTALSWLLLGFFALAPIVKIGGNQFLLLNIL